MPAEPEKIVGYLRVRVISYELPNFGAGNAVQVL